MAITSAQSWNLSAVDCDTLKRGKHLACPLCGKTGFSLSGIQQHRCPRLPRHRMGMAWYHDRLTNDQVRAAIETFICRA